jgi:hypothetical protein
VSALILTGSLLLFFGSFSGTAPLVSAIAEIFFSGCSVIAFEV